MTGPNVEIEGAGTVNGTSGYTFRLSAVTSNPNKLRMRILNSSKAAVYDNGSLQTLGGGSISTH